MKRGFRIMLWVGIPIAFLASLYFSGAYVLFEGKDDGQMYVSQSPNVTNPIVLERAQLAENAPALLKAIEQAREDGHSDVLSRSDRSRVETYLAGQARQDQDWRNLEFEGAFFVVNVTIR